MTDYDDSTNECPQQAVGDEPRKRRLSRRQFLMRAGGSAVAAAVATDLIGACTTSGPTSEAELTSAEVTRKNRERRAVTPGMTFVALKVNGREYEMEVDPRWSLAELLRNELGLTGTKVGCDRGECGACTVLMNGEPVYSCMTLAVETEGKDILTIEGLASGGQLHPIQIAFQEVGAVQCGFCTPGMILAAKALLDKEPNPTEDDIRKALAGNLCRCTGYYKIIEAVRVAAKKMA